MTTLDSSKEIQKNNFEAAETHEDFRMFGLITFLIADGMTFAGFNSLIKLVALELF